VAKEVELKLAIAEAEQRRLLAHPLLRHAPRRTQELVNVYYDTPQRTLYRHGIALRLRRQGRHWLQTVKCAGETGAGLSSRPEWEMPYQGHFDFSAVDDETVRSRLQRPQLQERIAPLFETRFRRTTWVLGDTPEQRVLVMLDRGWIAADGRREAISEVELELDGGNIPHLFDIADALAERVALVPASRSKAERGYRLSVATVETPVNAGNVSLAKNTPPLAAFRDIALSCLEQLQANHSGAISSANPEYIHQMRIATRRLRAALRIFRPALPPALEEHLLPALRTLVATLGKARDYDVLLHTIIAPVAQAILGEPRLGALAGFATERSYVARQETLSALKSPHYGRMLLLALRCLNDLDGIPESGQAVTQLAKRRLKRLQCRMRDLAAEADNGTPASLHALRIGIKRLRYGLEFFVSLYPKTTKKIRRLAELQDCLGQLNDLANAGAMLIECAGTDPQLREAVSLIGGWHATRYATLLKQVGRDIEKLVKLQRPRDVQ